MRGHAIEIKLSSWEKRESEAGAAFKQLLSHYVGSFSKKHAEQVYKSLDNMLDNESRKRKTAVRPRGNRAKSRKKNRS